MSIPQKKILSLKQKKLKLLSAPSVGIQTSFPNISSSSKSEENDKANEIGTSTVPLSGLCNLGNTCYANCILQVLRFCPRLSEEVARLSDVFSVPSAASEGNSEGDQTVTSAVEWEDGEGEGALTVALNMLWQRMTAKERAASKKLLSLGGTKPLKFLSQLRKENCLFDNKMQQDAQEMLRFLLTRLQATAQIKKVAASRSVCQKDDCSDVDNQAFGIGGVTQTGQSCVTNALNPRKRLSLHSKSGLSRKVPRMGTERSSRKLTDFFHRVMSSKNLQPGEKNKEPVEKKSCSANKTCPPKKSTATKEVDFITRMFQGELVSQIHCYDCDNLTRRSEQFLDVSVPVSSRSMPGFPGSGTPVKGEEGTTGRSYNSDDAFVGPFSLSWALSQFCYREKLHGENKYKCENCSHLVEAEKTLLFGRLPLVMTVHLNRFTMQVSYGMLSSAVSVSKIGGNLAIPTSLCLSAWCTRDCENRDRMYHLFAVVFHTGSSCSSGHYTACVKGNMCQRLSHLSPEWKDRRRWFYFDDEYVEELGLEEVLEMLSPLTPTALTAYILFYAVDNC